MSVDEDLMLLNRIHGLLGEPAPGTAAPPLATLEDTLTTGYAAVLELEAERLRLQRDIVLVVRKMSVVAARTHADEIRALEDRIARVDRRLANLRAELIPLKQRVSKIRALAA
jgi:predicted  nucleic acid-binding Zn-ribbon protein